MDITTGLVFLVVLCISYYIFSKPKNSPPGPVSFPVLGSIFLVRKFWRRRRHLVLLDEAKKYGNVMQFTAGGRNFVVLTGYDTVHEALVKQADVFSDRPNQRPLILDDPNAEGFQNQPEFVAKLLNAGIILQKYGHTWRKLRRFTLQSLRDFGVGKTSIEEKIFIELEAVNKALQDTNGEPVCTSEHTQKLVGNVLFGIVFGKRYDYSDPEFNRIRRMLVVLFTGGGLFSAGQILPKFIAKLIFKKDTEQEKRRQESVKGVRDYIAAEIKEHEETFDKDNIRDFVDIYLQTKQESDLNMEDIDLANMFRMIMDLFIAGSETTYTTLDWALLHMSELPDIQARCQREIHDVFGDKQVQYADRGKLPYLEATLLEIQRTSMIAPLSVIHATSRDTTLHGYHIPAGTLVMPSLYSASIDPKYWSEPEKFNPERFLDKSGNIVKNEAFMPFSTGPRVCLGEPLAKMELFLVFTSLLQHFTFKRENPNVPHSLEPKLYNLTNVPTPYKLRVEKMT